MSEPVIRFARIEDVPAITALVDAAYGIYVARIGRPPLPMLDDYADLVGRGVVHVLEAEGAVAGLVVLIREPDVLLLDNIAVAPTAQKRGFGRRLLAFVEETARAAHYDVVRLYTNVAMTENIALYTRVGYVETRRITEGWYDRVHMEKRI
ncbi:GNAT family N-acetyltransferase [Xanthobacteraceae bacterium A53D]